MLVSGLIHAALPATVDGRKKWTNVPCEAVLGRVSPRVVASVLNVGSKAARCCLDQQNRLDDVERVAVGRVPVVLSGFRLNPNLVQPNLAHHAIVHCDL